MDQGATDGPVSCELHKAAVDIGADESDAFLHLARSPIGDECQRCAVCRYARTYIERRLAERAGRTYPAGENAEAAFRELQAAIRGFRTAVHGPR